MGCAEKYVAGVDQVDYLNHDIRSQILEVYHNSKVAGLLHKLNFDITLYSRKNCEFLLKDLSNFIYSLNRNFQIFQGQEQFDHLEMTCFFEPWLINFLQKVLEKKCEADKFFENE